jgi:F-type H+-transporting ATPase subunit epsilon
MLARSAARLVRSLHTARPLLAEAAAASSSSPLSELTVTLALPHKSLVAKKEVKRVTLPGREGVFGVEKNSPAAVAELAPGLVRVDYLDNTSEEYFIPGGFSFKKADNSMDVSTVEGVKLDVVDVDALRAANTEAGKLRDAATAGSKEHAEAKIALEVYRTLAASLKVQL